MDTLSRAPLQEPIGTVISQETEHFVQSIMNSLPASAKCLEMYYSHQGIQRCRLRVASSVWWPGVTGTIEQFVQSCLTCQKLTAPLREPMLSTPLPNYPWEKSCR